MVFSGQTMRRASSMALALWVPASLAIAQCLCGQTSSSGSQGLDRARRIIAKMEKECQHPFVKPPVLSSAAIGANDHLPVSATTTVHLTGSAVLDFRPPVDPGFSVFPPLRCAPSAPLLLILQFHTTSLSERRSRFAVDSVWIRRGSDQYAALPTLTAADPADSDILLTRRLQRAPLWVRDTIDVFVRIRTPAPRWLVLRNLPIQVLR
jgi:hypothetical protein